MLACGNKDVVYCVMADSHSVFLEDNMSNSSEIMTAFLFTSNQ